MALPGGLAVVTVTGEFLDSSGQPLQGRITITPTADLADPGNSVNIPAVTRAYTLSRGRFTSDALLATDNSSVTPANWAYSVQVQLQDLDPISYEILLPQATTPVDLSALTPVVAQPAVSAYLTLAGGTVSGLVTLAGGLKIPAGAGAGDVLTSDSAGVAGWEPLSVELPSATSSAQGVVQLTADLGGSAGAPHVVHTNLTQPLPLAQGGTNAGSASAALMSLGALPLAGGTMTGPLALSGGLQIPSGAHSGYVLTSDGSGDASWSAATGGGGGTSLTLNDGTGNLWELAVDTSGALYTWPVLQDEARGVITDEAGAALV